MYDIDKLYLTGRIFNDGGSIYTVFNRNKTARAIGLKNRIVDGLWNIVTNPVNQVSGTIAVNIDSLKAVGKKSKLADRQKTFSQMNPSSVASMIAENSSGKQVIGIAAVANKGNSVIAYYYNNKMREVNRLWQSGNFTTIKSILDSLCKIEMNSEGEYIISSIYSNLDLDFVDQWSLNEKPSYDELYVYNVMKQVQENNKWFDDVDQSLGEILNAAADNAKELILKKINATGEWTDIWAYALTQGYTVEQIYDVMTNDELQSKLTTRNLFAGFKALPRWKIPFNDLQDPRNRVLKQWCDGAEEFGLLNGITKINQGIKTTEYEYLTFYHQFELGVNKILGSKPNELKFDMQKFIFDEMYRSEMISLYEKSKRTYNLLAMFAEHPMFMEMWRTYFVSSMFLQKISPKETLNVGVISANRRNAGAISKDAFVKLSDHVDKNLLSEFCKTLGFENSVHARNVLHKALVKYIKQLKKFNPDNIFAKTAAYSVIKPVISDNEFSVVVPGIDLYEVDKNWDLQETYAEILEAIKNDVSEIRLSFTMSDSFKEIRNNAKKEGIVLEKLSEVSLPELLWFYSLLNYKTNSAISFTRFAEEVGFNLDLVERFSTFVKEKANDLKWINNLAGRGYYVANRVKAISEYIQSRVAQIDAFIKESQLSKRILKNKFLESVQKEGFIELFDDTDLQKFKDLGFTDLELEGVLGAKAFTYDGVLYLNKDATYKDLLHEISHIMIINMSLTQEGRAKLHTMFENIMQTSLGQQIFQQVRQNPIYAGLSDVELEDEVVARYHEINPEGDPEWLNGCKKTMDSIETLCQQWLTSDALSTTKQMQKVKTFRNQQLKDGNIELQCE